VTETYRCQSRPVCKSRRDRTSFAPETTQLKRNERDRIEAKGQQHQRSRWISRPHDGLVEGASVVRTNNESIAIKTLFAVAVGYRQSASWSEGCAHSTIKNPRAAPLLLVRRDTQSYDEVIAAVPLSASPEHDVRNVLTPPTFSRLAKTQVHVPRPVAGNLSANAGDKLE
jgi:hypothetical protein